MTLADFKVETLKLSPDYEGEVVASLLRSPKNTGQRPTVLYLHGFVDYFFQVHVAEAFYKQGYDFYALDLRKCGRSYLPHQRFNYCEDIQEYFEEITLAIDRIKAENAQPFHLLAHSTGGLTACHYLNYGARRSVIQTLVLNSPFLDIPRGSFLTSALHGLSKLAGNISPASKIDVPALYAQTVSSTHHGKWDFDSDCKPVGKFSLYFRWVNAIITAQKKLTTSAIKTPVLLLHANRSLQVSKYSEAAITADTVLDVEDMRRIGPTLGEDVTLVEIADGMHDLFLSAQPIRERAMSAMFEWMKKF